MASIVMAHLVMTYIFMACIVVVHIAMACEVFELRRDILDKSVAHIIMV